MAESKQSPSGEKPQTLVPIQETRGAVSYLGVTLPKAENHESQFVPKKESYADYINDPFSLQMQKDLAISLLQGDPLLLEGGTSIGKTTAIKKMASELGWEVHYANLNYGADETKLMGKPMPNLKRQSPEDPEYVYWLGKVSSGLVPEDGKTKIIVLDELGSATPENLIMLHEILDAVERGQPVDLSEYGNGMVDVNPEKVKIVALTNPPGRGYLGRAPLDPALLRRFVYLKYPSELPQEAFGNATDALFGLAPQTMDVPKSSFLALNNDVLLPEQLRDIPGIADILALYKEFHKTAKGMVGNRQIGGDQPQPFTFDDRVEPQRVRDFILRFYTGDINQTVQTALRYYYANKLESKEDKDKLEEQIRKIEFTPSERKSPRRKLGKEKEEEEVAVEGYLDEKTAWKKVLGKEVPLKTLPDYVTEKVTTKLEKMGMELRFVPTLDLDKSILDKKSTGDYLKELANKYPNWKPKESLNDKEIKDHNVSRNLEEWYWQSVKNGEIDFPNLPGVWLAVETMPKPSYGDKYKETPISKKLGLKDRFSVSWDDATAAIKKHQKAILSDAGLPDNLEVRLPEAVEWNLLANREGWGQSDTYEWTNSEYRGLGGSNRVMVGYSDFGGAGRAAWSVPGDAGDGVGFRVAVVLGS